jgi:hypothetical protein
MSETNNDRQPCREHDEHREDCYSCQYADLRARTNPEEYKDE